VAESSSTGTWVNCRSARSCSVRSPCDELVCPLVCWSPRRVLRLIANVHPSVSMPCSRWKALFDSMLPTHDQNHLKQIGEQLMPYVGWRVTSRAGTDLRFTARHWIQQDWEALTNPIEMISDMVSWRRRALEAMEGRRSVA